MRTYSELIKLSTLAERFDYLKLGGVIGEDTFGFERYLNQNFYRSAVWKKIRNQVIIRDNGCEMGLEDYPISGRIIIHHMNPVDSDDIIHQRDILLNPEFLICVGNQTHNAIHYGSIDLLPQDPIERKPNDTCPWKKSNLGGAHVRINSNIN